MSTTAARARGEITEEQRYRESRRVTLVGSVLDLGLGVMKLLVGWAAHSQALIADGVHSLSDLATDVLVIFAAKHASRGADADHPYGHGRIETVATVLLGAALAAVAAALAWDAGRRLFHPDELLRPGPLALAVATFSILSKEWIYHYTMRVARRVRSNMLRANAWHSRTDAVSSIVVLVGVAGTMAGLPYLDAIAAIAVALMIAKIAWGLSWHSLRELIDTALEAGRVREIETAIRDVNGVRAMHMLRTRQSGGAALVDVHVMVSPTLSVSEGHQIGEAVRARLLEGFDEITDVTVHIDPEDDEASSPCDHLPLRAEMMARLRERWAAIPQAERIRDVTLHYLDGRVHVDLVLPLEAGEGDCHRARELADQLAAAARELTDVGSVRVYYQ